jgi:hypothetical protein
MECRIFKMASPNSIQVSPFRRVERAYCLWDAHISRTDQEKLETLLANLDKPISQMATQLSDLHDSLGGEFPPSHNSRNLSNLFRVGAPESI